MERLYRDFLLIVLIFLAITVVINFSPSNILVRNEQDVGMQCNVKGTFEQPVKSTIKSHLSTKVKLPDIYNTDKGDRIVEQMNFVPKGEIIGTKYILIPDIGSFGIDEGQVIFEKSECKVKNCFVTSMRKSGVRYDARIVYQQIFNTDVQTMQDEVQRHPEQIWIYYNLESPVVSPDYFMIGQVFNWTATYRHDSTIVAPYEKWSVTDDSLLISRNYAYGKTKKVAIFVSNCDTTNQRIQYVNELSKHIVVDIYGACGNYTCGREIEQECFDILKKDYKFYLAFENANCRDYITEKFYRNALLNNVLPVVMGAHPDDYKRSAPHHSYIHVEDFQSPKHLAEYLHTLDKNDQLYNQYFKWKGTGSFIDTKFWCRLCAMLNDPNKPNLIVSELDRWWRSERTCIRADQKWIT
ncbi:glycoprotein 3-alpha-L-fucosyltransferase A-like isoform X2 [Mytilus trossulus]|uniref:glycoprotein 3-alpha-L-fucosyltransferase A-like isoform X2 n=1 Tax=Mytilus trossulus TaxID=6551 RepID=UPI003007AC45